MTSPARTHRSRPGSQGESFLDWLDLHSKELAWAAVGAVVVVLGVWFYFKSQEAQARNASVALGEAEQALNSSNLPLAQSGLEKLVRRYGDTEPGKVGLTLLAQVHYQKGEYQAGIDVLKPLTSGDDRYFSAGALALAATGYEQMGKWGEAADTYQKAADKALFDATRDSYLSSKARALQVAGKTADARALWTKLAADPASPVAGEARVRLGELEVQPGG